MKYFITSDIHSFYDEFIEALKRAGYDKNNKDHTLIICGDIFDRGTKPLEIYEFLKSINRENRILIRGNHESLLKDLLKKKYPDDYDYHNGTVDTLAYLAKEPNEDDFRLQFFSNDFSMDTYYELKEKRNRKLFNCKKAKEIVKWIESDEWVNYFETEKFIFVHSWVPLTKKMVEDESGFLSREIEYDENWRNADDKAWDEAKWGCPWKNELKKLNKTGKTIVCGHWHAGDFWNHLEYENDLDKWLDVSTDDPIFHSDKFPDLIGLDACTALTNGVNVMVMENDDLQFFNHNASVEK